MKVEDDDLRNACATVYNDAMAEIQRSTNGRILPMALMPWWNIDHCVAELERAVENGARVNAARKKANEAEEATESAGDGEAEESKVGDAEALFEAVESQAEGSDYEKCVSAGSCRQSEAVRGQGGTRRGTRVFWTRRGALRMSYTLSSFAGRLTCSETSSDTL